MKNFISRARKSSQSHPRSQLAEKKVWWFTWMDVTILFSILGEWNDSGSHHHCPSVHRLPEHQTYSGLLRSLSMLWQWIVRHKSSMEIILNMLNLQRAPSMLARPSLLHHPALNVLPPCSDNQFFCQFPGLCRLEHKVQESVLEGEWKIGQKNNNSSSGKQVSYILTIDDFVHLFSFYLNFLQIDFPQQKNRNTKIQ